MPLVKNKAPADQSNKKSNQRQSNASRPNNDVSQLTQHHDQANASNCEIMKQLI